MFTLRPHRLLTLLSLLAYLSASTLGELLHEHVDCGHAHCATHDEHALAAAGDRSAGPAPAEECLAAESTDHDHAGHDDDCAICRFIGQRTLLLPGYRSTGLCQFTAELIAAPVSAPPCQPVRGARSRAPPCVG